jgi:hypothetical protein
MVSYGMKENDQLIIPETAKEIRMIGKHGLQFMMEVKNIE